MAKSTVMAMSRKLERDAVMKLSPSERLAMAVELSEVCMKPAKAGEKARRRGSAKKSQGTGKIERSPFRSL
jgi:hypothetical protein